MKRFALPLLAGALHACSAPHALTTQPMFAPPVGGVYQMPLSVVAGTEDDFLPSIAPRAGLMAYAANADGHLDIFVRPIAGGPATRLTQASTDDTDPAFSPDGAHIAWIAQGDDVKGDVWVMDADGANKRRLTDRQTADAAPAWRPDGLAVYFTSRLPGSAHRRVESVTLQGGVRQVIADPGWDASPSPDGATLFYVRLDEHQTPRVAARRLRDGAEVWLTDGGAIEALPHAGDGQVVLARYVDDQTGNGVVDVDDTPSLWGIDFASARFEGEPTQALRPLTAGTGGELFASLGDGWMMYTAAGRGALEIDALPLTGMIAPNAADLDILAAARAQDEPTLRRLALRHLVATRPALRATAHYELARELAERGRFGEAVAALDAAIDAAPNTPLSRLAQVEQRRLGALQKGPTGADQEAVRKLGQSAEASSPAAVRAASVVAEFDLLSGRRAAAVTTLEGIAHNRAALAEDRARAFDLLGALYATWNDDDAVARVSQAVLRDISEERFYAQRAALRWVDSAQKRAGVPAMAALEALVHSQQDLPEVAGVAAVALAKAQGAAGREDMALLTWERVVTQFSQARPSLREALFAVAEGRAKEGATDAALAAYEHVLRAFPNEAAQQIRARRGIAALGLSAALRAERAGDLQGAYALYERLLQSSGDTVQAQRRRLALAARLGKLAPALAALQNELVAQPRNKTWLYALGYGLTLTEPPSLSEAEDALERTLEIDPRFAAAHLTLGWIRTLRESQSPGKGWLERAVDSSETARTLLDPTSETDLWAAATLNKGRALFALGKLDDAFAALMARELCAVPFDSQRQEMLFREALSRVALRVGALDVALDQATLAVRLSQSLPDAPREATLVGLLAALDLQAGRVKAALPGYERAAARSRRDADWAHLVPMLRGQAMALQALGRDNAALHAFDEMLGVVAVHDLHKGADVHGLSRLLPESVAIKESPADAKNISAAVYGFDGAQEEDIAHAQSAQMLRRRGDGLHARRMDAARLTHVRAIFAATRADERLARLGAELLHALHDNALLALEADAAETAVSLWQEALPVATSLQAWDATAVILEASIRLRSQRTTDFGPGFDAVAEAAADAAQSAAQSSDPNMSQRLARAHALLALQRSLVPIAASSVQAPTEQNAWSAALSALDVRVADMHIARSAAGQSADAQLAAHLQNTSPDAVPAPASTYWRALFDRSLWDAQPHWLGDAIQAYTHDPSAEDAPELGAFLQAATARLLQAHDAEGAWQLLERARLRSLRLPQGRRPPPGIARTWAQARAMRAMPTYEAQLAQLPAVASALEGVPLPLQKIQAQVPEHAALVQVFAPTASAWHWFVLDAGGLRHVTTEPQVTPAWPEEVRALLAPQGSWPATLLVDAGNLTPPPQPETSLQSAILSATYWVVCLEARSLARGGVLAAGGGKNGAAADEFIPTEAFSAARLSDLGAGRQVLHLTVPTHVRALAWAPPHRTQILLGDPNGPQAPLDLDSLAGLDLHAGVALVDSLRSTPQAERALVQSLMLAGVPTALVGHDARIKSPVRDALARMGEARVATAWQKAQDADSRGLRFYGDVGMDLDEQVAWAAQAVLRAARTGTEAYRRAQTTHTQEAWQETAEIFTALIDVVDFLSEPAAHARLQASKEPMAPKIAAGMEAFRFNARNLVSEAFAARGDAAAAIAMRAAALSEQLAAGNTRTVLIAQQNLGYTQRDAGHPKEAARAFTACAALAASENRVAEHVACQSQLALAQQALYDYTGAERSLLAAIGAAQTQASADTAAPQRFLGLLYESALNNYPNAEVQFKAALACASRPNDAAAAMVPTLLLDLARISRSRGDYSQALVHIAAAQDRAAPNAWADRAGALLEEARVHWYRGNYRRAENRQQAALALAQSSGNTFLELQAKSLAGLIDLNQDKLISAEQTLREALALAGRLGNRSEQAAQLGNLGTVLREAGRLQDAEERFRSALALDTTLGSIEGRAFDLRNLALTLARQGRNAQAQEAIDEALQLSRSIGQRYNEVQCLIAIGDIGRAQMRHGPEIVSSYQAAAQLAQTLHVPEVEWRALYALGTLYAQAGDTSLARSHFEAAMEAAEDLSRGRQEGSTGTSRAALFVDAMALAIDTNDVGRAFAYAEQARRLALWDALSSRVVNFPSALAQAQVTDVIAAREALRAMRYGDGANEAQRQAATAAVRSAEAVLTAQHPALSRAFIAPQVSLEALQKQLPQRHAVVAYFVGPQRSVLFTITGDTAAAVLLPVGEAALASRLTQLTHAMQAFAPVDTELGQLTDLFLTPAHLDVAKIQAVTVVPHGPLYRLPFAALSLGDGPWLASMPLSYTVSASALSAVLREAPRSRPRRIGALAPAGVLHFAALEALAVAPADAHLGEAATAAQLTSAALDAVDLAAHGVLDSRDPLASHIELAPTNVQSDGHLELRAVFGLEHLPPLITLSACETAAGSEGAEWLSLAHAFWSAGASTVVASQYRVSDLGAALMMKHFYRHIRIHGSDQALQIAAMAVRQTLPHPAHWANFLTLGDFR